MAGEEQALLHAGGLLVLLTGPSCFLFSDFRESTVFLPRKEEVVPTVVPVVASEVHQGISLVVYRAFESSPKIPSLLGNEIDFLCLTSF